MIGDDDVSKLHEGRLLPEALDGSETASDRDLACDELAENLAYARAKPFRVARVEKHSTDWAKIWERHKRDDFHIEQYRVLRREIEERLRQINTMTMYVVIATAAIYSWLCTTEVTAMNFDRYDYAWWIPVMFPIVGIIRASALVQRIHLIGKYNTRIEAYFECPARVALPAHNNADLHSKPLVGWEQFLHKKRKTWSTNSLVYSAALFWALLLAGTTAVGYFHPRATVHPSAPLATIHKVLL